MKWKYDSQSYSIIYSLPLFFPPCLHLSPPLPGDGWSHFPLTVRQNKSRRQIATIVWHPYWHEAQRHTDMKLQQGILWHVHSTQQSTTNNQTLNDRPQKTSKHLQLKQFTRTPTPRREKKKKTNRRTQISKTLPTHFSQDNT